MTPEKREAIIQSAIEAVQQAENQTWELIELPFDALKEEKRMTREYLTDEEWRGRIEGAGFRIANFGDRPTHAICRHGEIARTSDESHSCTWTWLMQRKGAGA